MNIVAIWDRPVADPRYGSTFLLLGDGRFITLTPSKEFIGTDTKGERRYRDTGLPEYASAFNTDDRFTFSKAVRFMLHFGGRLLWKDKSLIELSGKWCTCDESGEMIWKDDNACTCGIKKNHGHCPGCGGVQQVG